MSTSIQGASAVLTEGKASGPLARMGSLISRVSLSLNRGASEELEQAKWPCSDSIPSQFFSCPGAAGYKVRGPAYFTDKKKVPVPVRGEAALLAKPPCGSWHGGSDKPCYNCGSHLRAICMQSGAWRHRCQGVRFMTIDPPVCADRTGQLCGKAGEPEPGVAQGTHLPHRPLPALHPGQQGALHLCVAGAVVLPRPCPHTGAQPVCLGNCCCTRPQAQRLSQSMGAKRSMSKKQLGALAPHH